MNDIIADWSTPAIIVLVGLLVGVAVERVVLVQLRKALSKAKMTTPGKVVDATKGAATEFITVVAVYVAIGRADVSDDVEKFIRGILFTILVFIVTLLVARLSAALLRIYLERTGAIPSTSIFANIIRVVVFILGGLIVLQHFGISITPIITALGVGGLAVALALQDTLSGLFSGLQILAARQIRPGDYIRLEGGEEGEVIDITWRNTIIRQMSNNEVIVPNSKMASVIVTNFQLPVTETSVLMQCGVAYGSDLERVEDVVLEIANNTVAELEGDFEDWEPLVRFHTFGESSVDFTIVLRAREFRDQYLLKHEFLKRLHRRFEEEGIEIPFPQRVVHEAEKRI